jgi:hypothetical protein
MTTITLPKLHWAVWATPAVFALIAAGAHGIMMLMPPPADLDLSRVQTSENGTFVATVEPGAIVIGKAQAWTIAIETADGKPVALEAISLDGGMPAHGHGLPTAPEVTRALGNGRFAVENMLFSMPGWWVVKIHVDTTAGTDTATFNFSL